MKAPLLPVVVVGSATGDIVLKLPELPDDGEYWEAEEVDRQVGGCALNVARALRRLQVPVINGIFVGNGTWGASVAAEMENLGLKVTLRHPTKDNSWCFAMMKPDGKRIYVSVPGCDDAWNTEVLATIPLPEQGFLYASGYELANPTAGDLREWLLASPVGLTLVLDFGPRLVDIDPEFIRTLPVGRTILSLNEDEITVLCGDGDSMTQAGRYADEQGFTIIARVGAEGAWICQPNRSPEYVPAYKVRFEDRIGAGDAHCGGMLAGLSQGMSLRDAVDFGNRVAAIVVSLPGANGAPTKDELENFTVG
ncbi:ribokinase [Xenorhabdus nematophila]|uniref:PfkB family carbohydrate kinase n=1 Tax=Xenorhabdus nematophila TaxID=628 RepID=UPI0003275D87|nr:PfkB family carbohydrate kinase [Xenorhabdus nematophila]CEE94189.1 putative sugar kinase with ribokinase-like domain [Xenorhabdus nematophila str. Anatoliense]CEF30979.1 putative sugar kinase with ribokinase-like domain [Xenorhabdus nematophila str. Websteri]AYA41605.1 ribokinase [Xenorhabdus nematophila]KHD28318.1 ribokinase [Xenorhabdus nematophila]MBA0020343.1 ribokinase [Xenorhabdus nematophila]